MQEIVLYFHPSKTNQIEDNFFVIEDKKADEENMLVLFCSSATSPQITTSKIAFYF